MLKEVIIGGLFILFACQKIKKGMEERDVLTIF